MDTSVTTTNSMKPDRDASEALQNGGYITVIGKYR
jgi:hypothetical protein